MSDIYTLKNRWLKNFSNTKFVLNGKFNHRYGQHLYRQNVDCDENTENKFRFGYYYFHKYFDFSNPAKDLSIFQRYMEQLGIFLSAETVSNALLKKKTSYNELLINANNIFKYLASNDQYISISNPYKSLDQELEFFLKLEAENGRVNEDAHLYRNAQSLKKKLKPQATKKKKINRRSKFVSLPDNYESDKVAMQLFERVENTNQSFFITGKAGTGKSTFVHYFEKNTNKKVVLLAFTGIAAINIGGQTIHSLFNFPLKPFLPRDSGIKIFSQKSPNYRLIKKIDTIFIDEVSMLRADLLEAIDYSLRINGGDPNLLFGGKQIIFVGDIFQLPPVVKSNVELKLFKTIYDSKYFFDAPAFKKCVPSMFEFEKVHRQANRNFVALLNKVRDCTITPKEIEIFNRRYDPNFVPDKDDYTITLGTTNRIVDHENEKRLAQLPSTSYYFKAKIAGEFKKSMYPTSDNLELKLEAQVMFVKNDSAQNGKRWVNGTIGVITDIGNDHIEVQLPNGAKHIVEQETWENKKYKIDREAGKVKSEVIGAFNQFPLKLAWAITIHKSQGLTFNKIILDLGRGTFANGQLYTALSRCKTFKGITLKRKIKINDIKIDRHLMDFHKENFGKKEMASLSIG